MPAALSAPEAQQQRWCLRRWDLRLRQRQPRPACHCAAHAAGPAPDLVRLFDDPSELILVALWASPSVSQRLQQTLPCSPCANASDAAGPPQRLSALLAVPKPLIWKTVSFSSTDNLLLTAALREQQRNCLPRFLASPRVSHKLRTYRSPCLRTVCIKCYMYAMLKKPLRRGFPMARGRAVRGGWQKLEVYSGAGRPRCMFACISPQRTDHSVGAPQTTGRILSLLLTRCWMRVGALVTSLSSTAVSI